MKCAGVFLRNVTPVSYIEVQLRKSDNSKTGGIKLGGPLLFIMILTASVG
jgi:hypothetical protein